ncbi:MAG: TraR/DksA family transcriptional regulator [Bdellovibrionales bacterium]
MDQNLVETCKAKLVAAKADLLNRYQNHFTELQERPVGGDEADQSMTILIENHLLATQRRLRFQLLEIESALLRIQKGTFGICEETEEPIERERLLAIPWTRLSIEGAEIREANSPKRA